MMMQGRPKMAIIDPNTLAVLGLKTILQEVMPIITVDTFGTFSELESNDPDSYVHFFVAINIVIENRQFFLDRRRHTIVLTTSTDAQMSDFHCLCTNVPERELIHSILSLQQKAHPQGKNLPTLPQILRKQILSDRELEVLSLIVQGYINKEIADKLCIGLTTVITHRKNITRKTGIKTVAGLTVYAILNGYVDINSVK